MKKISQILIILGGGHCLDGLPLHSPVLLPMRSSLTASNFEQLVLLKGNSIMFKAALKEDLKKGPDTVQE